MSCAILCQSHPIFILCFLYRPAHFQVLSNIFLWIFRTRSSVTNNFLFRVVKSQSSASFIFFCSKTLRSSCVNSPDGIRLQISSFVLPNFAYSFLQHFFCPNLNKVVHPRLIRSLFLKSHRMVYIFAVHFCLF